MSKVFISAGHGGRDSGAVGNGFKEKDLNLLIALACAGALSACGVNVKLSRTSDEDDDLNSEARESNAFAPDLTVSIHNNAGGGDGVEAWYSVIGGKGKVLANNILAEVVKIGQNSRGAKTRAGNGGLDYYGFIRMTNAPAVIVECAFIDNANDIKIIDTKKKCDVMGQAIAKGILNTLDISASVSEQTQIPPKKSVGEIAKEVLNGKWGNGADRKVRLTEAGYNYSEVQNVVNALCGKKPSVPKPVTTYRKSNEDIAREVITGKWGNGADRKARLTEAGYNYSVIQKIVNQLCKR